MHFQKCTPREEMTSKNIKSSSQVTKYENMTKDVNRSAYTRRIMEIVSNIKKQNNEIEKVSFCCVIT